MTYKHLLFFAFLFFLLAGSASPLSAQPVSKEDWKLKKQEGKIKIYTRDSPVSPIKELRMTANIRSSMETFLKVLNTPSTYQEYVYKCTHARRLKTISENEYTYYLQTDVPFPATDRDLVVYSKIKTETNTGIVHIFSSVHSNHFPEQEGYIRVPKFEAVWKLTPLEDGTVDIDYEGMTDPGGDIPVWIVNMTLSVGPLKTMQNLTNMVEALHIDIEQRLAEKR